MESLGGFDILDEYPASDIIEIVKNLIKDHFDTYVSQAGFDLGMMEAPSEVLIGALTFTVYEIEDRLEITRGQCEQPISEEFAAKAPALELPKHAVHHAYHILTNWKTRSPVASDIDIEYKDAPKPEWTKIILTPAKSVIASLPPAVEGLSGIE